MNEGTSAPPLVEVHVTTADGVDIACFEGGEGPPLVVVGAPPFVDTRFQWRKPALLESTPVALLLRTHRVIQFDPRGCGSSQRNVNDYSLAARVEDFKAVMERYAPQPIPLIAMVSSTPVAIAYVAGYPERVSHLIITDPYAHGPEFYDHPQIKAMLALREHDWEFYTETVARGITSWRGDDYVRALAEQMRSASSPDAVRRFFDTDVTTDVRDMLPKIRTPTLVVQSARVPLMTPGAAERIANEIPAARLRVLDASWGEFDAGGLASAITDFIGDTSGPPEIRLAHRNTEHRASTAVILFTDIVDSSLLTERMGDAAFRERARGLDAVLRRIVREHDGVVIDAKTLGDGILATFAAASQGISAALACAGTGEAQGLPLHLGLHAGDVIRESDNVFGGTVNIAARISALSAPGEVLVSDVVRALARTSAGVVFEDLGEHTLKGIAEPQRVFRVVDGRDDEATGRLM